MGAVKEKFLTLLDHLTEAGKAERELGGEWAGDEALIGAARDIARQLGADGLIPEQVDERLLWDLRSAYADGRRREPDERDAKRLADAVEAGLAAMWGAFAKAYPEITTGDFGPGETMDIENAVKGAFELMIFYNRPIEGTAPTAADAAEIVAAREAAAVERLTPAAQVIVGYGAFILGDLAREVGDTYVNETLSSRDFYPVGDDAAERALRERVEHLIDEADGAAGLVEVMVSLLGEHRTAKALVEAAEGGLCDARDSDGTICAGPLDDGEGWDGKCGTHADAIELSVDQAEALGLDGTGRDDNPRFPYTFGKLTDDERARLLGDTTGE